MVVTGQWSRGAEVEGACELVSSGDACGGVWKKVKSKEKSGRCVCVGVENWGKKKEFVG